MEVAKGKGAVDQSRITRLLKRFYALNFKMGHQNVEVAKDICFAKGKGAVDHSRITRLLKKFYALNFKLSNKKVEIAKDICRFVDL